MIRAISVLVLMVALTSQSLATEFFGGRTVLFYSPQSGTSVIYFVKRGNDAYLWYPGSDKVLKGRMQALGEGSFPDELCLTFGKQRYSPISGLSGGSGRCAQTGVVTSGVIEQAAGDIFGLQTCPTAPAEFGTGRPSLRSLAQRAGIKLSTLIDTDALTVRPGERLSKAKLARLKEMAEGSYQFKEPDTTGIVPPPCG